jgi:translocation and assembly module TamB
MPEEIEQREEGGENPVPPSEPKAPVEHRRRRYFTRRNLGISTGLLAVLAVLLAVFSVVFYKYGVFDNYVKTQFTGKMARIGIVFDADVFRVTVSPLELELKNATFNDRVSGEKLFFIRDAHLALTVQDLYAWQLSRDIKIDTTDINGAEVWVRFDENGRSNFANLNFVEEEGQRVNFLYESIKFSLKDGVVHFGDVSHRITADANNVQFFLEPEDPSVPDEHKRYKLDLTFTDSRFVYDDHPLEDIDIRARGIADRNGADITELKIETPIGLSTMNGRLSDWESLKYDLNIESTVDLTQTSNTFPLGTPIRGVGNFQGHVTGEGENYRVEGTADSESLTAEGVYLKGVNIEATVEGTNSSYDANGTAIAELLTFEDFRIDFPKLTGNVRGTGTDFRWIGDLQAAAAKSKSLTIGGLFLHDATAELKDRQLTASAASGRAQRFSVAEAEFADLTGSGLKFSRVGETNNLNINSGRVGSLKTKDYQLSNLAGRNVRIKDQPTRTDVNIDGLTAASGSIKDTRLRNVKADSFNLTDVPAYTDIEAGNVRVEQAELNGTRVTGLEAPVVTVHNTPGDAIVYSDQTRVARIDTGSAVLGSLNIAGVRLTIQRGTVQGTSNDIDAGNIALSKTKDLPEGGNLENVRLAKPVFVLEPSGRYRASADMSLGGGVIGSIPLGNARAAVNINNDRVELNELNAKVMEGEVNGRAVIALSNRTRSDVNAVFTDLDLAKLVALQGGRVIPLEGKATGNVNINFAGTNFDTATGTINADIVANAGRADKGFIPVNGKVALTATNGLFNVDQGRFNTPNSELTATGRFDVKNNNSDLDLALNSTDAAEVERLVRVLNVSPDLENQLNSLQMQFAGNLNFNGKLTGNFTDPVIDGRASVASVSLHGREVGSVATDVFVSPTGVELRNGNLRESTGGSIAFNVNIPRGGANNTSVQATLTNVNAGNLLAALPVNLPERLRDFTGLTSGTVNLTGMPNNSQGEINISSTAGTLAGQAFDSMNFRAVFSGTRIDIQNGEMRLGQGLLTARGMYDYGSNVFDLNVEGKGVPLPLVASLLPQNANIPNVTGTADFTATASGDTDIASSYNINFNGTAREVVINENPFGIVTFKGNTVNQVLNAEVTANLEGRPQVINASVNFADENLPFRLRHELNQSPLRPFFALIPQLQNISLAGTGTGTIEFGGNLAQRNPDGTFSFTSQNLTGTARFTQLDLLIQDTPLSATEPVVVRFSPSEITVDSARFAGGGSNVTIAGTKALTDNGINNLSIDGRVNLSLLNAFPVIASGDIFFSGFADVAVRLAGVNRTARLSGSATLANASIAAFIGSDRLTFDRLTGRILFSSDQAQIEDLTGFLGGGRFNASGGALFGENLQINSFRVELVGTNVTVPLPQDFITTGDASLEISGRRINQQLSTLVSGRIVARRSLYTRDIELANIVGARHDATLSAGSSSIRAPRFDLTIEGRDALIVRNNIADLTASVSLRLTGTTENPRVSGRITANSGTVFFRNDRYIVQRGVLEFPPGTAIEPVINLQAETEIAGYQIFVNLSGPLTETSELNASVRSSPALPQADVISLVTTGNLTNNESGLPSLAQTGINTAAEVLTDTIINNPIRKATNKLFGLNVFEIDPIISGERLNASARLTVGRQINNNLRITYATNLSQDQNQVVALEYRVSNKLSVVAQYEQQSLSNVARNRDNFSIEIRFRRRF